MKHFNWIMGVMVCVGGASQALGSASFSSETEISITLSQVTLDDGTVITDLSAFPGLDISFNVGPASSSTSEFFSPGGTGNVNATASPTVNESGSFGLGQSVEMLLSTIGSTTAPPTVSPDSSFVSANGFGAGTVTATNNDANQSFTLFFDVFLEGTADSAGDDILSDPNTGIRPDFAQGAAHGHVTATIVTISAITYIPGPNDSLPSLFLNNGNGVISDTPWGGGVMQDTQQDQIIFTLRPPVDDFVQQAFINFNASASGTATSVRLEEEPPNTGGGNNGAIPEPLVATTGLLSLAALGCYTRRRRASA